MVASWRCIQPSDTTILYLSITQTLSVCLPVLSHHACLVSKLEDVPLLSNWHTVALISNTQVNFHNCFNYIKFTTESYNWSVKSRKCLKHTCGWFNLVTCHTKTWSHAYIFNAGCINIGMEQNSSNSTYNGIFLHWDFWRICCWVSTISFATRDCTEKLSSILACDLHMRCILLRWSYETIIVASPNIRK